MKTLVRGIANMKRTNVVLDERIVGRAKKMTGIRVTRHLLDYALRELVRHRKQREILKLQGKIDWEGDLAAWREGRRF